MALFGEDWGRSRGMLVEGSTVYVTAKCAPRYANSTYLEFKINSIDYMQTIKENRIEKLTITLDSDIVDDTVINDFNTMLKDDLAGKLNCIFRLHDVEKQYLHHVPGAR